VTEAVPERPRQVTLAAWTIMGGSFIVLLLTFELITNLHTLQTRESVQTFLDEPPGDGLGISVESALVVMRTFAMIAAGCATAAGILGFHVLRRHKPARIALTVLALPLLVSGMVTGGFFSSLVAASAFLLWLPPARDWFEGREPAKPLKPVHPALAPPDQRSSSERSVETTQQASAPRAVPGFGAQAGPPPGAAATSFWAPASTRPSSVVWACALTWLFSGVGIVLMVIGLGYFVVNSDPMLTEIRAQNPEIGEAGLTDEAIVVATVLIGFAVIVWAMAAMVLAFLFYRGISWSRLVLLISTGGAVGLLAFGALTQWALIVPFVAAALTFSMLLRPEAAAWVNRPPANRPPVSRPPVSR
jgi:hypothetical protein